MDYLARGSDILLPGIGGDLSLPDTLDCGQAFRWREADGRWRGFAGARYLELSAEGPDVVLHDTPEETFLGFWRDYFDLDRDYASLKRALCRCAPLACAVGHAPGIRVLRQDPWEALCTFIVTQNNNVPRIRGIVERLCGLWGEQTPRGAAFPTPQALADLTEADLAPLRCGYRAPYLLDCARRVCDGRLDLAAVAALPTPQAREALRGVRGVGPKVAECALLFGFGRTECFPMDVWMKRAMAQHLPDGLPEPLRPVAGIAQQYLFHYARTGKDARAAG